MLPKIKRVVIAPHADDEVLSCSSVLDKNTCVYYCGIDESEVAPDPAHRLSIPEKRAEIEAVANFFGFYFFIVEDKVNQFQLRTHISAIESQINLHKPEEIYIPHPGGYNQDHQTIYSACMVALRPHDKNHQVQKVFVYEGIHDFLWCSDQLVCNTFISVDINRKIVGYELYKSQVRPMRSSESLRQLVSLRGKQIGVKYTEGFKLLRWHKTE